MAESIVAETTQQTVIDNLAANDAGDMYGNIGNPTGGEMPMPSVEEIWKMIEEMDDISDEDRASIRENLFNPKDLTAEEFLKRMGAQSPTAIEHSKFDYMIFIAMIAIIVLVFALFGYKLYKSLTEKELKKQEKQKLKQSKKSKKTN